MRQAPQRVVPARWAQRYLSYAPNLVAVLAINCVAVLVGIRYYVETMPEVSTFLWPLYADSPTAVFLMALSLATLLPFVGRPLDAVPRNRPLAYLHTIAFVWLVDMGLWTVFVLNLNFWAYFPAAWAYFGIVITHLGFVGEAFLIPHYGATTRGALVAALAAALLNDVLDYGVGLHPPFRGEPGLALVVGSVALSLSAVALAAVTFDQLRDETPR